MAGKVDTMKKKISKLAQFPRCTMEELGAAIAERLAEIVRARRFAKPPRFSKPQNFGMKLPNLVFFQGLDKSADITLPTGTPHAKAKKPRRKCG